MGEYRHSVDEKGRLAIPARFRDALGTPFVITKGLDGCLFCYPMPRWSEIEEKLRSLPLSSQEARAFVRFFFAGAAEIELDRQGRAVIPAPLREHGHLYQGTVIVGVADRCEIWAAEQWESYQKAQSASPEVIAAKLGELGVLGL